MKRLTLAALAAMSFAATGCAEPEPSLLMTGHVYGTGSIDEESGRLTGCTFPTTLADIEFFSQSLFVNLADFDDGGLYREFGAPFAVGLVMENRLVDSSDYAPIGHDQNLRLDQNAIQIQGYNVTFDSAGFSNLGSGGELVYDASYVVPTDGGVYVALDLFFANEFQTWSDAFAGAGGSSGVIVPTFAEIQAVGETVGGTKVESNVISMPIQVCDGCNRATTSTCVAVE